MATLTAQNHALTIGEAGDLHVGVLVSPIRARFNILYSKIQRRGTTTVQFSLLKRENRTWIGQVLRARERAPRFPRNRDVKKSP